MKTATIAQIKKELKERSHQELINICIEAAKLNINNKILLTYLLFEAHDKQGYISNIKHYIDDIFSTLEGIYRSKKVIVQIKKILATVKNYIRFANDKESEIILLLYFCKKLNNLNSFTKKKYNYPIFFYPSLNKLYNTTLNSIGKKLEKLDEDLQHDYGVELQNLKLL